MRRLVVLALLLAGMELVLPLGARGFGSQVLLTFGFLILAAYTIGELAPAVGLPRIVGYLATGVLFGPSALGVVTPAATAQLAPVSALAIALIAFLAGAELRWEEVRSSVGKLLKILGVEFAIGFVALAAIVYLLADQLPFTRSATANERVAFSLLFAAIAVVHSPAVTMALLSETGARGPVARTTLGVVLLSDVVVVLLFTGTLAAARAVAPPAVGVHAVTIGTVAWEIAGALLLGAALGAVAAGYLRFVRRELALFALLMAFLAAEITRLAHVETLLALLVMGFVTENLSRPDEGAALRHTVERSAAPVFVVFFALAGAAIAVAEVAEYWVLVLPLVLVRGAAVWVGTRVGGRWARASALERRYVWMGLVSQAGVAIGLASVVANTYPGPGTQLQAIFLATLAVNQVVGPVLFRHALARSGELASRAGSA